MLYILFSGNGLDATGYVDLAVERNGHLPPAKDRRVDYIWGDAIQVLKEQKPDLRIINLENSITTNPHPWPDKGIHYRMHPKNVDVILSADIDCCVLSNNHILDWSMGGLLETLSTLKTAGIKYVGAGHNETEAMAPAVFDLGPKGRVLVFAGGHHSSGVFMEWKATSSRPGVNIVEVHRSSSVEQIKEVIKKYKREGDIVVFSIHWGGNWGFDIDEYHKRWAHSIIDTGLVDVIHGHSSHHVKGVEVYKQKLIIYGCGDFLNDYEGIHGHERQRGDLALMYFPQVEPSTGKLLKLVMVPTQTKYLRVNRAGESDIKWLLETMDRECRKFGGRVVRVGNELHLEFSHS